MTNPSTLTVAEVVASIERLTGISCDRAAVNYLAPVRGPLLTALGMDEPDSVASVVTRRIQVLLVEAGVAVRLQPRDLREFLATKTWQPIHDALAGVESAKFAVTETIRLLQGGAPVAGTSAPPAAAAAPAPTPAPTRAAAAPASAPGAATRAPGANVRWRNGEGPRQDGPARSAGFTPQVPREVATDHGSSDADEVVRITTPVGEAVFPYLHKPDYEHDADGLYKTKLAFVPQAIAQLTAEMDALRDRFAEKKRQEFLANSNPRMRLKAETLRIKPFARPEIDDNGVVTGRVLLTAKSHAVGKKPDESTFERRPRAYDADALPLETMPTIWSGSQISLACIARPYARPNDDGGTDIGITLYLEAVQIVHLVTGSAGVPQNDGFRPVGQAGASTAQRRAG